MNKKQLVQLIREQRPEPPHGFEARVEYQLARIAKEEKTMKKRYKLSTILIAATLLVAMFASVAFAVSELQLIRVLFGDTAVDEINERVDVELGDSENNLVNMSVEEAVYDGKTIGILMRLDPCHTPNDALICAVWLFETQMPESVYDFRNVRHEDGTNSTELLGRKDGKRLLCYWPVMRINGEIIEAISTKSQVQEDGSALVWLQYNFESLQDEPSIQCDITAEIYPFGQENEVLELPGVTFELTRTKDERTFELIPTENDAGKRFAINSAVVTFAKVTGYLTIEYTYTPTHGEEKGIDLRLLDAQGNRFENAYWDRESLGNNVFIQTGEIQTLTNIPDTLFLEAKVIGEDKVLGIMECRLVESEQ